MLSLVGVAEGGWPRDTPSKPEEQHGGEEEGIPQPSYPPKSNTRRVETDSGPVSCGPLPQHNIEVGRCSNFPHLPSLADLRWVPMEGHGVDVARCSPLCRQPDLRCGALWPVLIRSGSGMVGGFAHRCELYSEKQFIRATLPGFSPVRTKGVRNMYNVTVFNRLSLSDAIALLFWVGRTGKVCPTRGEGATETEEG